MRKTITVSFLIFIFLSSLTISAQEPYKLPPKEVLDIVDAPPSPRVSLNPTGDTMLIIQYESMPSIAYMSQPILRIAGTRLIPKFNSRQTTTFYTGIIIKSIKDGSTKQISLPGGSKLSYPRWSHDGKWFAFLRYTDTGLELWAAEAKTGKAKALTGPVINATVTSGFSWLNDSHHLLAYTVPEGRGNAPEKPAVPVGPNIQTTTGKFAKVWTYQDLLQTPYDEKLFTYYATSQIIEIDVTSGSSRKIADPAVYLNADPSPDGKLLLVYRIKEPYSYSVPYYNFTHSLEIWDRDGSLVHLFADLPLADEVPMRGVPTGPRSVEWRALKPATLIWVEALDEGNPEKKVPHRDKLLTLSSPFKEQPKEILKIQHRYSGIAWMKPEGKAFLTEYNWKKRWRTTYLVNVDDPSEPPQKVFDISSQDRYNDPGRPVYTITPAGEYILLQDKNWIYLSGSGASPKGDMPFLDRMNLKTMKKERLFHCGEGIYESFVDFVGKSRKEIITSYQSKTEPPNYYLFNLKIKKRKALTDYKDPAPQLTGMKKQLIKYKRADGVDLSGTLYLPPDYKEGDRLPLVVWAYPLEYSDPRVAGQVRGSPHRFTFFRGTSQLFFVTQGYAVLDGAQMPVVGDPKTMNDTFVEQIVSSLKAAIDKLDSMGVIDPKRVGVGGHSYGAFMTANLLAHCDLLAAGIARSGAYNRTLTPFGFQSERRTLWEDPEIYFKVSPFMHAHKINEPILLIHGEADNNSGTFPIQSRRLFHALKGHGATARLVMLPNESHGYRARESVLHVLSEMFDWFDKYVKKK
ncbi:MAG: prolyl oligopeptidase family serine peptidase [Candidatus Aminicenantes bacterium]|nr:prolyl oligopeptidase family serine peptidase [Candidatus Aminicenantes bacterium]MBL7083295.1 prolyl oligopeptidase family serine peptidase [Candidatus Aminicenantes bacterium]